MKVAKLVTVNMTVRIIVDENATDDEVIQRSLMPFKYQVNENLATHISLIEPDVENPFGTYTTDSN
jgi:hypothetical protein